VAALRGPRNDPIRTNGPAPLRGVTALLLDSIDDRRWVATPAGGFTIRVGNPPERWRADTLFTKEPETTYMTKRLFLFDLDGVILDSRENMEAAWEEVRKRCRIAVSFEDYFRLIGRPFQEILSLLAIRDGLEEIERVFRMASMNNLGLAAFYDGIEETLVGLEADGVVLGIVTSKDRLRTGAILAKLPVSFQVVQTPNDLHRGKPAPDHLLVAMAEANIDPQETIYIGDMDADYEAATRAGVDYAHASWGYGTAPPECKKVMKDIGEIRQLKGLGKQ
jgi:phosphoglycolate phosphatase